MRELWAIKGPDGELLTKCFSYSKAQSLNLFMDYFYGGLKQDIKPQDWETICNKRDCKVIRVRVEEIEEKEKGVAAALRRQGIDPATVKPNNAELVALSGQRFETDIEEGGRE